MGSLDVAGQIFYIVLVLFAIAFFVASKFSFTKLRRNDIEDIRLNPKEKQYLAKQFEHSNRYVNTMQFFIISLVMILGYLFFHMIHRILDYVEVLYNFETQWMEYIVLIVVLFIMTIIVLSLSEIVPKAIALSYPEGVFTITSHVASKIGVIVRPFVYIASFIGRLVLRGSKAKVMNEIDLVHSEKEIRTLVNHSQMSGAIDKIESDLIANVFDFVDRIAKEVMVPRQEVVCLYAGDTYEENRETVQQSKHTRYPLCDGDKDHIIGLIHVKDFMEQEAIARKDISLLKRKILIVPEVMKLSVLLQNMRTQRIYQSVVVDEYGGMVGLVGLEDIVEELVGDIKDEHEETKEQVVDLGDGAYDFDGTILVEDVEEILKVEFGNAEEDTLGGFTFGLLGQTPEIGDHVTRAGYELTVSEMQGYRISRVIVTPVEEEEKEEEVQDHEL